MHVWRRTAGRAARVSPGPAAGMRRSRVAAKQDADGGEAPDGAKPAHASPRAPHRSRSEGAFARPEQPSGGGGVPIARLSASMPILPMDEGSWLAVAQERLSKKRFAFIVGILIGAAAVMYAGHRVEVATPATPLVNAIVDELSKFDAPISQLLEQLSVLPDFAMGQGSNASQAEPRPAAPTRPGLQAAERGWSAQLPVVMLPGIISTGLEMWSGQKCAKSYFRQRVWGTLSMIKLFTLDRECWLRHMELDALTGDDPPGIKLRAAQGFEAADYVVGGYWVWAQVIENLADIGYSPSNAWVAAYDWRLPYHQLERRDQYFSRLRYHIEMFRQVHGRKVAVVAHSMGATVWQYFSQWISSPHGGRLSSAWVHEHIEAVVLIGPPTLGTPKGATGLLMGESRDFTYITGFLGSMLDSVLSAAKRRRLMRSFPSTQTLLPMGGAAIWGDEDGAPDDPLAEPGAEDTRCDANADGLAAAAQSCRAPQRATSQPSFGALLSKRAPDGSLTPVLTVPESLRQLEQDALRSEAAADDTVTKRFRYWYDLNDVGSPGGLLHPEESAWINPLKAPLPFAPNMTVHCLYGVGQQTERAYVVVDGPRAGAAAAGATPGVQSKMVASQPTDAETDPEAAAAAGAAAAAEGADEAAAAAIVDEVPYLIDRQANDRARDLVNGVRLTDGDGTIPLVSMGYMCASGWRRSRMYNPSGARVVTREFVTQPSESSGPKLRGSSSADHVDILGNEMMISDLLTIVSGHGHELTDRVVSDIARIADNVDARLAAATAAAAARAHSQSISSASVAGLGDAERHGTGLA